MAKRRTREKAEGRLPKRAKTTRAAAEGAAASSSSSGGGSSGGQSSEGASGGAERVTRVYQQYVRHTLSRVYAPEECEAWARQEADLHAILEASVVHGEANSVLLMGFRGCGKTLVLERVLARLEDAHPGRVAVARLSGLVHTSALLALRAIAAQLTMGMSALLGDLAVLEELENTEAERTQWAAVAAEHDVAPDEALESTVDVRSRGEVPRRSETRVAVPERNTGAQRRLTAEELAKVGSAKASTFAAALARVSELVGELCGSGESGAVIFVLDEFDLFAGHAQQALLYNLLSMVASATAGLVVVGLTARLDAIELLEKRVRSRFMHRRLDFFSLDSFSQLVALLRERLSPPAPGTAGRAALDAALGGSRVTEWEASVKALLDTPSTRALIRARYDVTSEVLHFLDWFRAAVGRVNARDSPWLEARHLHGASLQIHGDARENMLRGLSILELWLLVTFKVLVDKGTMAANFEMVYDEYSRLASSSMASVHYCSRKVAAKAFEHLEALQLIVQASDFASGHGTTSADDSSTLTRKFQVEKRGGFCHGLLGDVSSFRLNDPAVSRLQTAKEYRMSQMMLTPDQVVTALKRYPRCPTALFLAATSIAH